MQTRINDLRENLKSLQKSYDDALNQSQTAEVLLNTKFGISEALIRDQLDNSMKQRYARCHPLLSGCDRKRFVRLSD